MHCSNTIPEKPRPCLTAPAAPGLRTRLRNAAVLIVLIFAVPQVKAQTGNISDINLSRLAEAVKAISQGDLPKAENLLNSVLASSPRTPTPSICSASCAPRNRNTAEAERLFRLALAAAATHIGAHVNLGKLLLTMNRTSEALQILQAAHRLAPERAEINLDLATLYADSGDYQRALEYLRTYSTFCRHRRLFPRNAEIAARS